jgi:hypothetical protein
MVDRAEVEAQADGVRRAAPTPATGRAAARQKSRLLVFSKRRRRCTGVDPWKTLDPTDAVRVDIPELGVMGGCLVVIGGGQGDAGLTFFPSLEGLQALAAAIRAQANHGQAVADFGSPFLSVDFWKEIDLPPSMRREILEHRWPIAGPEAYPVLRSHGADGGARPLSDRDVRVMAGCAGALAPFVDRNRAALVAHGVAPIVDAHDEDGKPVVVLTVPYDTADRADGAGPAPEPRRAPPSVGRNDPCPCGSGRKYKKCHLLTDEAGERTDGQGQRSSLHDLDNRLVVEIAGTTTAT